MKVVDTKKAPGAIGPYAQAQITGNLVYTSGQLPVNPETGEMPKTIEEQTKQSCENVKAILEAGGTDMTHVVKTLCFLADINDFAAFNAVYADYFTNTPARSCIAVKDIPKGALCEIEVIAEIEA